MMVRYPVVAGQFYPDKPDELRALIKDMVDEDAAKEEVIGLIAPHAGYIYSGPVAGAVISRVKFTDTFIIIGPSHTGTGKPLSIMTAGTWKTPLGDVEIDTELANKILESSENLQEDAQAHQYEHSIEVQLPFLQYFKPDVKLVPIVLGYASGAAYKEIGLAIARAMKELDREAVIIASSDMTHYESRESAWRKDMQAIGAIVEMNEDELLKRIEEFDISMCGYAPAISLIAAAKELGASRTEFAKYMTSGDTTGDFASVVGYAGVLIMKMSAIAQLAKETVETFVRDGKVLEPKDLTPEMKERAGVFVSIHKLGALRGCIGTYEPRADTVAEEIVANAISAATDDPRFPPVSAPELPNLDYSVDILTRPEPVKDEKSLDAKKYGVIVQCGWRRGLLLPDLEGVDTPQEQISICCEKGGISPGEPLKLYRFEVKRYR
ncbi:MAG: AmmeMemoRadiSam system protein B [Chloroflexota bacterium]